MGVGRVNFFSVPTEPAVFRCDFDDFGVGFSDPSDSAPITLDIGYRLYCHGLNLKENTKTES